jgi:ceramide glucosyltransferase
MNTFVSGNIIASWAIAGRPIIVGKSMLIERETLEKLGGFAAFDSYLAEDYIMGVIYRRHGFRVATNYAWVTNFSNTTSAATFFSRMSRWAKMRLRIDPFFYCLEILPNPLAIAFISIFFLGRAGAALFAASFLLKLLLEYASLALVNKEDRGSIRVLALYPLCALLKDAMLFIVYVSAFFSRTVKWHGRSIRIGAQSRINFTA